MGKIKSKYNRGDEFTIRIEEIHTHYSDNGNPFSLYRAKGFSSLVFDDNGLDKLERKIEKDITDKDYHKEYDSISCPHCGMTLVRFVCMSHHYCYVCGGKFGEISITEEEE